MTAYKYNAGAIVEDLKVSCDIIDKVDAALRQVAESQHRFKEHHLLRACIAHMGHYPSPDEIQHRCHLFSFPNGCSKPSLPPGAIMLTVDGQSACSIHPVETDSFSFAMKLTAVFYDPQPA